MSTVETPSGPPSDAAADGRSLDERLQAFVGLSSGPPFEAHDPVNVPMIRHWVEAMGDENPVYLDEEAARAAGFDGIIAPPTMLQAWTMAGLKATLNRVEVRAQGKPESTSPSDTLMALLDEAGFSSVVATNCDQHYVRPLRPGDQLEVSSVIDSVSGEKATGLGLGHFITTRAEFTDQHGEPVATMKFSILKFKPKESAPAPAIRPNRPRPALTHDNRFFFEGAKEHKLLIQRCTNCGTLRHPPRPACANCRSFQWDTLTASGRGTIYSYTVNHYPQVPAFDYPLVVALVELEEGTRLVANVTGITPETVAIGMPVVATFEAFDDDLTLPVFRPDPDAAAPGPAAPGPAAPDAAAPGPAAPGPAAPDHPRRT